ncbi:MAG: protein kinase [Planctomyces sp.]|nr:protein kinase [Planctomyces sp.]
MSDKPQLDSLFEEAVQIADAAERAAFLDQACGADQELRRQIERLLKSDEQAGSFLANPVLAADATIIGQASGDLAASMDAGLAATFGPGEALILGEAGHSVLKMLGQDLGKVPRVVLLESAAEGGEPVVRPGSAEMPDRSSDSRYQFQGEIARGGMGAILKGRDTDLGRDLAIKVLLDAHKDKPDVVQRFVEEAQIGGQLQHPGIAPVYELGQFADKRPFFSMKLVKGQTFSRLLAERKDPSDERGKFLGIFEQICQTMAYAHSRGVIHRDLKPANVMVGAFGEVQVMDWGLAKVLPAGGIADEQKSRDQQQGQSIIQTLRSRAGSDLPGRMGRVGSQTQIGSVMGTPAYMPPEQALGEVDNLDERADVFGLGAILCEVLTGQPPYVASDGTQVYRMATRGKLDDCFTRLEACGADAELIALAKNCMAIEPKERPRNAKVLTEQITGYLTSVESRLHAAELQSAAEGARAEEAIQTAREHELAASAERRARRMQVRFVSAVLLAVLIGGIAATWTATVQSRLKNDALEAEQKANKARIAESVERERAQKEEQRAKLETQRAEAEKLRSDRMSAGLAFDRGLQSCAEGNVSDGLLWMAESLGVTPAEDKDFARVVSSNLQRWCTELVALRRIIPFEHRVHAVAYTPDGRFVVTGDAEGHVRWFDAATGEPTGKILEQPGLITCIEISRDGKLLATGSNDRELRVWDTESGELRFPPIPQPSTLTGLDFSVSGHQLAVSTGIAYLEVTSFARVYDTTSGEPVSLPLEHPEAVMGIRFHSDGSKVVTSCNDGLLRTWDIATGQTTVEPIQFPYALGCMATNTNRELLAVVCGEQIYIVYLPGNSLNSNPINIRSGVYGLAFHPNHVLLATVGMDGNARVWNRESKELIGIPLRHQSYVNAVAFSPDGLSLVTGSEDQHVRLFDLPLRAMIGIPVNQTDSQLMLRDDPRSLVSGRPRTYITGRIPDKIPHWIWDYLSASFSADGRYVVTGSMDNHAYVWDLASGKRIGLPLKHANWVRSVAFHPDSRRVLTGSHDMTARLWDAMTGEPLSPPLRATAEVAWVEFSNDGLLLLTKSGRDVQLWNNETAVLHGPPLHHSEGVVAACFSHDGRTVATSLDGGHPTIQFWDVATSHPLGPPLHAIRTVTGMRFEEGDRTLLTCSDEGITRRWTLPPDVTTDADTLRVLPQVVTGQKLVEGNVRVPLEPADHHNLRTQWLTTEHGKRWQGSPADIESWHNSQAAINEISLDGGAAFWHFEHLLKLHPEDWTIPARYCIATRRYAIEPAATERWQRAKELAGVVELRDWCRERALQKQRIRYAEESVWFLQQAIELDPDNADGPRDLGNCYARLGRFEEAKEQFLRVVALAPRRIDALRDLAMIQLALDDREAYRATCHKMLEMALKTDDIEAAYHTALACVLDPECVSDWTPVIELATRSATAYEGDQCLRIAAHYRAGQLDEDFIDSRNTTQVRFTHNVWEWFFQGMYQVRIGRRESGQAILREKIEMVNLMDQIFPHDHNSKVWVDWIYHLQCHSLATEAKTMLE